MRSPHWETAVAYSLFAAAIFDLLDGLVARLLKVSSEIGKQLDSLADMISFGLVPALIMIRLLGMTSTEGIALPYIAWRFLAVFPFSIAIFSALRLAKFNIDTRQSDSFIGLPTPANTLLIVSFPLILVNDEFGLKNIILNPYFIIGVCALQSFLLVSELPLIALKFKNLSWKDNSYQFILIISSAVLLLVLKFAALPLIIFLYVLLSLVKNQFAIGNKQ